MIFLFWNGQIFSRENIWTIVAQSHQKSPMADLDWAEMEGLFCQQQQIASTPNGATKVNGQLNAVSASGGAESAEKKRKETSQVTLLDGKRSLNINIFLKQFRSTNEQICAVSIIRYLDFCLFVWLIWKS